MLPGKKILLQVGVLFLLIALIVFIILKYFRAKIITTEKPVEQTAEQTAENFSQAEPPTPTPTPTPTLKPSPKPIPLPPGKGVYNVSQGQHQGPSISQVSFDPLDVRSGQELIITAKVADKEPVTSVTAILQLDKTQKNLTFKLINGTNLSGNWQTSIKIDDTLWYRYILIIKAVSANGSTEAIVAPRS